jgi:alkanesulfonate monooxygenase SsuD/methylene tetrahydromethanopterin reductase-like flavin-dependent oxidoreductase (luciferase family)
MDIVQMGVILPGGTATEQLELALVAERAGWDGVFVWEAAYGVDAWTLLAAMAARTSRIRLGTLLTPLPWRRPWKVASQVATLDQLSEGRAILTVGLGALASDLPVTGEVVDLHERADLLDEGIDLIRSLWDGGTSHHGSRYSFEVERTEQVRVARPVQDQIPIWVVGLWPRVKSMARVLRCDGIVPQYDVGAREASPDDVREIRAWLKEHGGRSDLDVIGEGETPIDDPGAATTVVSPWAEAGCTWWLETRWEMPHHTPERTAEVRERLAAGPPRRAP